MGFKHLLENPPGLMDEDAAIGRPITGLSAPFLPSNAGRSTQTLMPGEAFDGALQEPADIDPFADIEEVLAQPQKLRDLTRRQLLDLRRDLSRTCHPDVCPAPMRGKATDYMSRLNGLIEAALGGLSRR